MNDRHWFTHKHEASGSAIGFRVDSLLHQERSPQHAIEVYQSSDWGRLLVLDGRVMVSGRDHFLRHEMLAHPALFTHSHAKHVVLVGAADCGTLREVLRHEHVESALQVGLDERVTRLAERYFPALCEGNADPRVELRFGDSAPSIAGLTADSVDVLVLDDHRDDAASAADLGGCLAALRYAGILVQASGSPLLRPEAIGALHASLLQAGFQDVRTLVFPQPSHPGGWSSCTLARKGSGLDAFRERAASIKTFATRYYSAEVHRAALTLPPFLHEALQQAAPA